MALHLLTRSGGYAALERVASFWRVTCSACPRWAWTGSDGQLARDVYHGHAEACACAWGACEMAA